MNVGPRRRILLVEDDEDTRQLLGVAMLREAHRAALLDGAATLVVTAHPDPEGVAEATLVHKPLDLEKFLLQVRRIFESRPRPAAPAAAALEPAPPTPTEGPVELTLYISPASPPSMKARRNMERLLDDLRAAAISFDVLDLAREPERAEKDKVVFTPTLVKRRPEPRAWILGDLSDPAVVADLLHMCGIEPIP